MPPASGPPDRCAPNDRHSRSISDTQHAMDGSTCVCCGGPGCERAVVYGVIVRVKMRRRRVTHRSQLGCCGMAVCRRASQTRESAMVLAPAVSPRTKPAAANFFRLRRWRASVTGRALPVGGEWVRPHNHPRGAATRCQCSGTPAPWRRRPTSHGDGGNFPCFFANAATGLYQTLPQEGQDLLSAIIPPV